jgi:hypothetical protein
VYFDFRYKFFSETFLGISRIKRGFIIRVRKSVCKVPVIVVKIELNLNFLERFVKSAQITDLIKIAIVAGELSHAD